MTMAPLLYRDNKMTTQEGVNITENAIDDDVVDIMTIYPPWSQDTNDTCDITQLANDKSIKDI